MLKIASFFYNFFTIFYYTISICIMRSKALIFTGIITYIAFLCSTKRLANVSLLKFI